MPADSIMINRAPVLTLWAAVVAEPLGTSAGGPALQGNHDLLSGQGIVVGKGEWTGQSMKNVV